MQDNKIKLQFKYLATMKQEENDNKLQFDKRSDGERTRDLLKEKGIESPNTTGAIKIKRGLWITPKEEFNTPLDRLKWVERMKAKYIK